MSGCFDEIYVRVLLARPRLSEEMLTILWQIQGHGNRTLERKGNKGYASIDGGIQPIWSSTRRVK